MNILLPSFPAGVLQSSSEAPDQCVPGGRGEGGHPPLHVAQTACPSVRGAEHTAAGTTTVQGCPPRQCADIPAGSELLHQQLHHSELVCVPAVCERERGGSTDEHTLMYSLFHMQSGPMVLGVSPREASDRLVIYQVGNTHKQHVHFCLWF